MDSGEVIGEHLEYSALPLGLLLQRLQVLQELVLH
jgi:hypothetical protein